MASSKPTADPYSMPAFAPLYGRPPFHYRDSTMALIPFVTTQKFAQSLVPAPLVAGPNMTLTLSRFQANGFGRYKELALAVEAQLDDTPGSFTVCVYLDEDIPFAAGREIWGWPKKEARIELGEREGMFTGRIERGGIEIASAAVELSAPVPAATLEKQTYSFFNRKLIPSVVEGKAPEVDQLTLTTFEGFKVRQAYAGPATISFGTSPADPLHQIPVESVGPAYYMIADMTLPHGKIVHDYNE